MHTVTFLFSSQDTIQIMPYKLEPSSLELLCPPLADDAMDFEMEEMEEEEGAVPLKRQKAMERCKFWPVCKSGDECSYHHPTTQCK